jgi:hypothetical protein
MPHADGRNISSNACRLVSDKQSFELRRRPQISAFTEGRSTNVVTAVSGSPHIRRRKRMDR